MSKANDQKLSELHGALADALRSRLKSPDVTAADLNVIRAFLKDNNITAVPVQGSPLGNLLDAIPHFDPADLVQ